MKKETNSEPKFKTKTSITAEPALFELFLDCLRDIYWAENHLVKTLPKMSQAANSKQLVTAIEQHLAETVQHVSRLEQIFGLLEQKTIAKKCDAMEGITKEGEGVIRKHRRRYCHARRGYYPFFPKGRALRDRFLPGTDTAGYHARVGTSG